MNKKVSTGKQKAYLLSFVLCVIVLVSLFLPLPYYIEQPGSAEDVQQFVKVDGKTNDATGAYLLTTVGIRQATPMSLLLAKFDSFKTIETKEAIFGEGDSEEFDLIGQLQMTSSENMAKKVALDLANVPYELKYQGVFVHSVLESSDFNGKLQVGDVVYQVDDVTFESVEEFMDYVQAKKQGDTVELKIKRAEDKMTVKGKITELDEEKTVGIGISLSEQTTLTSDKKIQFDVDGIGGPSAGLMFSLEIYENLMNQSFRKGYVIAGTGEIRSNGEVGMIGGIDKKVKAADEVGAQIFFAPDEAYSKEILAEYPDLENNYQEALKAAKKIKTKMTIVPVKTIQDALTYMESLPEKNSDK